MIGGGGPADRAVHRVPVGRQRPHHRRSPTPPARARSSATPTAGPSRSPTRPASARSSSVTRTAGSSACATARPASSGSRRLRGRPRPRRPPADRPRRHGVPLRRRRPSRRDRAARSRRRRPTSTATDGLVSREVGPNGTREFVYDAAGRVRRSPSPGVGTHASRLRRRRTPLRRDRARRHGHRVRLERHRPARRDPPHRRRRATHRTCASTSTPSDGRNGSTASPSATTRCPAARTSSATSASSTPEPISWRSDDGAWGRTPRRPARRAARRRHDAARRPRLRPASRQFLSTDPLMTVPGIERRRQRLHLRLAGPGQLRRPDRAPAGVEGGVRRDPRARGAGPPRPGLGSDQGRPVGHPRHGRCRRRSASDCSSCPVARRSASASSSASARRPGSVSPRATSIRARSRSAASSAASPAVSARPPRASGRRSSTGGVLGGAGDLGSQMIAGRSHRLAQRRRQHRDRRRHRRRRREVRAGGAGAHRPPQRVDDHPVVAERGRARRRR